MKRYLHYEKAHLDGELDPAFGDFGTWEYRMVVSCDAPDETLAWGREMLRNYRPDLIRNNEAGRGRNGGNAPNPGAENGTGGGDGGKGGGLFVASGAGIVWKMHNSTVISNFAGDGGFGGSGPAAGSGGPGGDAGNGGYDKT